MIKLFLQPRLNLFDVVVYSVLFGLHVEGYLSTLLFVLFCIVSGGISASVQHNYYKEM